MKRIICLFLCVVSLLGCNKQTEKLKLQGIIETNYQELTQNLNLDVTFLLYIGRPDCGDCQTFYPILEDYINSHENTGIYYLNIKDFRDKAKRKDATKEEKDFYENLYEELDFDWTPTIHEVVNGKFVNTYQYLDEDYFEIKDRKKQKAKRQEFIDAFYVFMDDYFKEE